MSIEIKLTRGFVTVIDDVDSDLAELKWTTFLDEKQNSGPYAYRSPDNIRIHQVIMERILGRKLERGELADHVDGDGLNNKRENLRLSTFRQNAHNQKRSKRNTSGYKGVSYYAADGRWRANIRVDGKLCFLGYFNTPEEAHEAYKVAAVKHFGEFARFE